MIKSEKEFLFHLNSLKNSKDRKDAIKCMYYISQHWPRRKYVKETLQALLDAGHYDIVMRFNTVIKELGSNGYYLLDILDRAEAEAVMHKLADQ